MTNLDILRRYFPMVVFDWDIGYRLNNNYSIDWLGVSEDFTVMHHVYDSSIGGYNDFESDFYGDLLECLDHVLELEGNKKRTTKKDRNDYLKIVKGEN